MSWFDWDGKDLLVSLHVQPRARNAEIVGLHGDRLKVKVKSPPEGGRANREITRLLAQYFSVAPTAVSVKSGASGRRKRVRIVGAEKLPVLPGLLPEDDS